MTNAADFPFTTTIPVQWGDMDSAQHVNNVIYLRWAESARIDYVQQLGIFTENDAAEGIILAWQDCKYIFPVTYPDKIIIGSSITAIEESHFMMACHMFSERHQRLAAITSHKLVPYNYKTLQRIPLPAAWRDNIQIAPI